MEVQPGEVYWLARDGEVIAHPHVVMEASGETVLACALTTNRKRAGLPGNVLLEPGEAGLPRASVVEVAKLARVKPARLGAFIGALAPARLEQIRAGMRFVERMRRPDGAG